MKILKRILLWLAALFVVLILMATIIIPEKLDRQYNTVTLKPPYKVSKKASDLYHSLDFVADMHCDALLWKRDLLEKHDFGSVDIPRMKENNVAFQVFTIVTKAPNNLNFDNNTGDTDQITLPYILQRRPINSWFNLKNRALAQSKALHEFEKASNQTFFIIKSRSDLERFLNKRKKDKSITSGLLGIEGMHALNVELDNVDVLYDAGVRMMAPVHFFDNALGGSAHGVSKEGLTDFGRMVIKKMQEKDMIVDVAHSSPKMLDDILEISTKPVVSSHTGVQGHCNSIRNISDEHLIGIARTGGLISIAMFETATCGKDPKSTAKAIKYCIDLVGADHVALGSDFDGAIEIHTDITGLPLYVEALMELGVNEEEINKVMGDNVKRFLLENLPEK